MELTLRLVVVVAVLLMTMAIVVFIVMSGSGRFGEIVNLQSKEAECDLLEQKSGELSDEEQQRAQELGCDIQGVTGPGSGGPQPPPGVAPP